MGLNGHKFHCSLKSRGLKYTDVLSQEARSRIIASSRSRLKLTVPKSPKPCQREGCQNLVKTKSKYCSMSCSAKVNNLHRVQSPETREKIRRALYRGKNCRECGTHIKTTRKLCDQCLKKFKQNQGHLYGKRNNKLSDVSDVIIKKCQVCNKEFTAKRRLQRNKKTCGDRKCINALTIWSPEAKKKQSENKKKAYALGVIGVHGGTTKWHTYKGIRVQGSYELRVCSILDTWVEKGKISNWEYTRDRFKYIGVDRQWHSYNPDFKVIELHGEEYYIEVKGFLRDNDELKWEAARKTVKLDVWFESEIIEEEDRKSVV